MATGSSTEDEPALTIPRPPRFWGSGFGRLFAVAACVTLVGSTLLVVANIRQPAAAPTVTLKGIMASKQDFFHDKEVQRLLREHHIVVEVIPRGSREVAHEVIAQPDAYDFAFPSGQAAADLIRRDRSRSNRYNKTTRLFTSPVVLASFREYAEALAGNQIAVPHGSAQGKPIYYTLDTAKFIKLGEDGKTWNDIGFPSGNTVLARTPGVCRANSAGTYLGLVAFVKNGNRPPQTEAEIDRLAQQIKPIITATGMPEPDLFEIYVTPEGKSQGPIVVVYEHQFFAHQLKHQQRKGSPDTDRVLLYPRQEFQSDPEFISLKEGAADRLAELLDTDPALRKRMMELGYRVLDDTSTTGSEQLYQYLQAHGVPTPAERTDLTRAELPELDLLEKLIRTAGRCAE